MKKLVVILMLLSLLGCMENNYGEYLVNKECRTQKNLFIKKVVVNEEETIIDFEFVASSSKHNIGIFPPGHDMAFFITDIKNSNKYQLIDSERIAIRPNSNKPKKGDTLKFQLTFESIPMNKFHIIEGKLPTETSVTWHFTNIKLDNKKT